LPLIAKLSVKSCRREGRRHTVRARSGVVKALQHRGRINHVAAGESIHAIRDSLANAIITVTTIVRF
jgi:hypothetical protein